jgi:hypothetical protein
MNTQARDDATVRTLRTSVRTSVRTATVAGMTSPLFIEPIYPVDIERFVARVGPCTPIQRKNK